MIAVPWKDCWIIPTLLAAWYHYCAWSVLVQSYCLPLLWPHLPPPSRGKAARTVSVVVSERSGLCPSLTEHLIRVTQYCVGIIPGYLLILDEEGVQMPSWFAWAEVLQGEEPFPLPAYLKREEVSRGLLKKTQKRIFALPFPGGLTVFWYSVKICKFYFRWENLKKKKKSSVFYRHSVADLICRILLFQKNVGTFFGFSIWSACFP